MRREDAVEARDWVLRGALRATRRARVAAEGPRGGVVLTIGVVGSAVAFALVAVLRLVEAAEDLARRR